MIEVSPEEYAGLAFLFFTVGVIFSVDILATKKDKDEHN